MDKNNTVFIAYSGGGESEKLSKEIYDIFSKNFKVVHYGTRIENGDQYDINELMQQIGAGQYVIMVIDEKYLTNSIYCAEEIRYIMNNWQPLDDRIFPIFSQDFNYGHEEFETRELKQKARNFINTYLNNNFIINESDDDRLEVQKRKTQVKDCIRTTDDFIDKIASTSSLKYESNEISKLYNNVLNKSKLNSYRQEKLNLKPLKFKQKFEQNSNIVGRSWTITLINTLIIDNPKKNIFWFKAEPGYGKSAIASYIYKYHSYIGAIYFIEYEREASKEVLRFLHTIINQLFEKYEWYRNSITDTIDNDDVDGIFDDFIYEPLSSNENQKCLIIVDGLDESFDEKESKIGKFLRDKSAIFPKNLKMILLSQPDGRLSYLEGISYCYNLDDAMNENTNDCKELLNEKLTILDIDNKDIVVEKLLYSSNKNMLYINMYFKAIEDDVIEIKDVSTLPNGLNVIYEKYLERMTTDTNEWKNTYAPYFALMVVYKEPIPKLLLQNVLGDISIYSDFIRGARTLLKETDTRITFYNLPLRKWFENIDIGNLYFMDINRAEQTLNEFIDKLNQEKYQEEYINFFFFNKKIIEYFHSKNNTNIKDFVALLEKIDINKLSENLSELIDYYIQYNDINIAKQLSDYLFERVKEFREYEKLLYVNSMMQKIKILDMEDFPTVTIKEKLVNYLSSCYPENDGLTENYIKALNTFAYEFDRTKDFDKALEIKKKAYSLIKEKYNKDSDAWYMVYIEILKSFAYTIEQNGSRQNKIEAFRRKKDALDIIDKHISMTQSIYLIKNKISTLTGLSYTSQKLMKHLNEYATWAKKYAREAYDISWKEYQKNEVVWIEQFIKASNTYINVASDTNKIITILAKIQEDITKFYNSNPDRWRHLYAKTLRMIANIYANKKNKEKYLKTYYLVKISYNNLYEKNPDKYISEYISFLGQARGKCINFNENNEVKKIEELIEKIVDDEIEKKSTKWGNAYLEYVHFNKKYEMKQKRLRNLAELNPERWFSMYVKILDRTKLNSDEKIVLLKKEIHILYKIEDYKSMLFKIVVLTSITEDYKISKDIYKIIEENYSIFLQDDNLKKPCLGAITNMTTQYLMNNKLSDNRELVMKYFTEVKKAANNGILDEKYTEHFNVNILWLLSKNKEYNNWEEIKKDSLKFSNTIGNTINVLSKFGDIGDATFKNYLVSIHSQKKNTTKKKCELHDVCFGKIIKIFDYGLLMSLPGGNKGLLSQNQIKKQKNKNLNQDFSIGQELEIVVWRVTDKGLKLATKEFYDRSKNI